MQKKVNYRSFFATSESLQPRILGIKKLADDSLTDVFTAVDFTGGSTNYTGGY